MHLKLLIVKNKWLLLQISILTISALDYWYLFDFLRWDMFDSPGFTGGARLLFGVDGGFDYQSRISKPLVLLLPGFMEWFFGLHSDYGFLVQSAISFFISGFLVFSIFKTISGDPEVGMLGMLTYILLQCAAVFSIMILADTPGWMVSLLLIRISLVWFKGDAFKPAKIILMSFLIVLGFLIKESAAYALIFFVCYMFFGVMSVNAKFRVVTLALVSFLVFSLISQLITHVLLGSSIFSRVVEVHQYQGMVFYRFSDLAQVYRVLDNYWVLFLFGVWIIFSRYGGYHQKRESKTFMVSILLSFLLMPVYPFIVDRIMFMVAPGLIYVVLLSRHIFKEYTFVVISIGGVLNIAATWLIYRFNYSGILLLSLLFFIVMVIALLFVMYYKNKQQSI